MDQQSYLIGFIVLTFANTIGIGVLTIFMGGRQKVMGEEVTKCLDNSITTLAHQSAIRTRLDDLHTESIKDAFKTKNWSQQSSGTSSEESGPNNPKTWTEQSSGTSNETSGTSGSTSSNQPSNQPPKE